MLLKTIAAGLGAACLFALPAVAFEIVTDDSGFAPPVFFADDPDGDGATAPTGNPFITSLGPFEYRTPKDAFDEGYSYSGYSFEDEKLAEHVDEAKVDAPAPQADATAPTKITPRPTPR
jgi:hypothetical protein